MARTRRATLAASLFAVLGFGTLGLTVSPAHATTTTWQLQPGSYRVSSLTAAQGLATVTGPGGTLQTVYRGDASIPLRLLLSGWVHVGDPGARGGYLVDAYEGPDSGLVPAKLFEVTAPDGTRHDFVHPLDAAIAEQKNNSFAAVSPDGKWLVSGEWGAMTRLLVFPTPLINTAPTIASLPLVGTIRLRSPVTNVQGCDFVTATQLACSTAGTGGSPMDLLRVDLDTPLSATTSSPFATVTVAAQLPKRSACSGSYEGEGLDYSPATGVLRVEVIPPAPCFLTTTVYSYRQG